MSCYMCENEAPGSEHVPPRCLFPEQKDLPEGVDLRRQLITVPACDEHNTAKSKDDEYLLHVLAINLPANEVAKNQFLSKVLRSFQRNSRLLQHLMQNPKAVTAVDDETEEVNQTVAVTIDDVRLDSALDHIARALYYHHFGEKWTGSVRTQPDFLLVSLDPAEARELNEPGERMAAAADQFFDGIPFHGENPDVFKYQVIDGNERLKRLMRLHFYNGCRVTVFFVGNG